MTNATIDWAAYRAHWPYLANGTIWMHHAGVTPPCRRVLAAANAEMERQATDPAHWFDQTWGEANTAAKAKVAALYQVPAANVALVKNTSTGLLQAAWGLDYPPGSNLVLLAGDFPSNRLPWRAAAGPGIEIRNVWPDEQGRFTIDSILAAVDHRTVVVAASWVQYINGFRLDLAGLGQALRAAGVWFVVDGVQGAGALPCDLAAVDAFAVGGHKWMCGTEGGGWLYLGDRLLEAMHVRNISWQSVAVHLFRAGSEVLVEEELPPLKPGAARVEEGTPATWPDLVLGEAATMLAEVGLPVIEQRLLALHDHLLDRLAGRGYEVTSSLREGERSGILCLRHPDHPTGQLVTRLREAGIITMQRGESIRLAPHFYNNLDDMDQVAAALP